MLEQVLLGKLKESNYAVVLTGAGMSTESGLPDFRSSEGLREKEDPSRIANTDALNRNNEKFFAFYRHQVLGLTWQGCGDRTEITVAPHCY